MVSPDIPPQLGVEVTTVGLLVTGAEVTAAQETDLDEALGALSRNADFYVERGYTADDETLDRRPDRALPPPAGVAARVKVGILRDEVVARRGVRPPFRPGLSPLNKSQA